MKKQLSIITMTILIMMFTSCASVFTGSKRKVMFESDPPGAKVYVNGIQKGRTPVQLRVKADDRIDFRLEDYTERVIVMDSKFNLVSILNGFSIIGWGIDAITGSLKRVDTKYVKVTLDKDKKVSLMNYIENGTIQDVKVDAENKVIETIIVLND